MKFHKVILDYAVVTKYNPAKKNTIGGIGTDIVKVLQKGNIVLVTKVEPTPPDNSGIKGNNYYIGKKNFVTVIDMYNPFSTNISMKDIGIFAIEKIKEPRTIIILGIIGAVIIGTQALLKK